MNNQPRSAAQDSEQVSGQVSGQTSDIASVLVDAQRLSRHYDISGGLFGKRQSIKALSEASFTLKAGKTLAVVGESGCGKSTLARLVTMIETPTAGTLVLDGHQIDGTRPISESEQAKLRASVQIVFQNPFSSLNPRQTIGRILEEPLLINRPKLNATEREQLARQMLEMTGLRPEHYERYPHMFSGGQRQRIAVARALMLQPRILVLDEPVSALDLSIQSQILNLLVELQERLNLAYLFISHDLSVVKHMADDIMVMYLGRVVESGSAHAVFSSPRHPYTQALLSATPIADPEREKKRIHLTGELPSPLNPPKGCAFNPRCWKTQIQCQQQAPTLEPLPELFSDNDSAEHQVACYFPL